MPITQLQPAPVTPWNLAGPFDALLALKTREQEQAAELLKLLPEASAGAVLSQPGAIQSLTQTPSMLGKSPGPSQILQKGLAAAGPPKPKVTVEQERLIANDYADMAGVAKRAKVPFINSTQFREAVINGTPDAIFTPEFEEAYANEPPGEERNIRALARMAVDVGAFPDIATATKEIIAAKMGVDPALREEVTRAQLALTKVNIQRAEQERDSAKDGKVTTSTYLAAIKDANLLRDRKKELAAKIVVLEKSAKMDAALAKENDTIVDPQMLASRQKQVEDAKADLADLEEDIKRVEAIISAGPTGGVKGDTTDYTAAEARMLEIYGNRVGKDGKTFRQKYEEITDPEERKRVIKGLITRDPSLTNQSR